MKLSVALMPACLLLTHLAAQNDCRIAGTVINSVTGQPMSKAWVMLASDRADMSAPLNSYQFSAAVDSSGKFQFAGLAAGTYRLAARRDGFDFDSPASDETDKITLVPGAQKSDVVLRLLPLGAISGRITADDGDPVRNVRVDLIAYRWNSNGPTAVGQGSAETNDLGEYRIYDISPGKYYLRAVPRIANYTPMGLSGDVLAPEFYPGTLDRASAVQVEIHAGDQVRGGDLVLRRLRGGAIRGRVAAPPGFPATARTIVGAEPISTDGWMDANLRVTTDRQGNFQIRGVPPGLYTLRAQATVDQKDYSAGMPLQAGSSDIDGVFLRLSPPMDVKGVVRVEGAPNLRFSQIRVYLSSVIPRLGGAQATVRDDGTFTLPNVSANAYRVRAYASNTPNPSAPATTPTLLYLKSVRCGDAEAVDGGVDFSSGSPCQLSLVLSANGGRVNGTVAVDAGAAPGPLWVTIAPSGKSREYQRARAVKVEADATFQIADLPPGFYKMFAWQAGTVDVDTATYDPEFTKRYEDQGQSIQVSEGSAQAVTLKVVKVAK